MNKIITLIFSSLLFFSSVSAQINVYPQPIFKPTQIEYGYFNRSLGIPTDTLTPPPIARGVPHIAAKGMSLYMWDTTGKYWVPFSSGADSTIFATLYRKDTADQNLRNAIANATNQKFGVFGGDDRFTSNRGVNMANRNMYFDSIGQFDFYAYNNNGLTAWMRISDGSIFQQTLDPVTGDTWEQLTAAGSYLSHLDWNSANSDGDQYMYLDQGHLTYGVELYPIGTVAFTQYMQDYRLSDSTVFSHIINQRGAGRNIHAEKILLDVNGIQLWTKTHNNNIYKGLRIDTLHQVYIDSMGTAANMLSKKVVVINSLGKLESIHKDSIGSSIASKFGKSGEDVTAAENRAFDLGSSYDFLMTGRYGSKFQFYKGTLEDNFTIISKTSAGDYSAYELYGGIVDMYSRISGNTNYLQISGQTTYGLKARANVYQFKDGSGTNILEYNSSNDWVFQNINVLKWDSDTIATKAYARSVGGGGGSSDGNGIYTGSGSLSGTTVVTQSTSQLKFTNSLTSNTTGGVLIEGTGSGGLASKITTEGRGLYIDGSSAGHTPLEIDGKSTGYGIRVNQLGGGIASYLNAEYSTTNGIASNPVTQTSMFTSGTAAAGIGFSEDKNIENSAGSAVTAIQHLYRYTTATASSEISEYSVKLRNSGSLVDRLVLSGNGAVKLNAYTSTSSFTGTPVGSLGFDASGNILTMSLGGGSYTDEEAQDASAALFTPDDGDIDYTYNDATPSITSTIKSNAVTFAKMQAITDNRLLGSQGGTAVEEISLTSNDFDLGSNTISIDYTNGQASSGSLKGFLTSSDWTMFNNKIGSTDRRVAFQVATGTDANITAVAGTAYHLPAATLSTGRTIDMANVNTNGDYVEFYNNEEGFVWSFTGQTVYDSDGATVVTELLINANSVVRRVNGKLMISKL